MKREDSQNKNISAINILQKGVLENMTIFTVFYLTVIAGMTREYSVLVKTKL